MSDVDHARILLGIARSDLKALEGMVADPVSFDDAHFGFQAQQAVEKSLKAWIERLGKNYPQTHDLQDLLEILEDAGEDVADLAQLVDLNSFAVEHRYLSIDEADTPIERQSLLKQVKSVVDRVAKLLQT